MMVVDDFGRDEISNAVSDLQKIAGAFSQPLPAAQSVITLQIVVVVGAKHPWRLLETARSSDGRRRRRMLCFDSVGEIRRAIDQYLAWQHADEQFVATHMATPGLSGVTTDWVPSAQFEWFFASSRDSIRGELCPTSAKCSVSLPHR